MPIEPAMSSLASVAAMAGTAAIAKAGVCVVSLTEPVARATAFKGRVWVGDTRCMVATRERADVIAAAWRRMGAPDTATAHRWTLALEAHLVGFFQDPRYVVASAVVQTGPRSLVMTADMSRQAWLATELVELVTTLHPDATWHLRGATDPVLAWLYVVDAWEGGLPSARYLGVMSDAAEVAGAPPEYVHDLRTRPARTIGPGTGD